jgi:putative transport protein
MQWLQELFLQDSVPHAVLIISLVVSSGLVLGLATVSGIRLGIAGVLFSGLIFGHYDVTINENVMHFIREFGLILFVYAIGLQVGPSFVSAFFKHGLRLNGLAAGIVILGAIIALAFGKLSDIPVPVVVGLYSGGTTNTPSLAAAQQVLSSTAGVTSEIMKLPGLGYAIAYPFGIIGIILAMMIVKRLFKIDIDQEANNFAQYQSLQSERLMSEDLLVENPNLNGMTIEQIPFFEAMGVVVTRILHKGDAEVRIASHDTPLMLGDIIRIVGTKEKLRSLKILIGSDAGIDLQQRTKHLLSKRLIVTNKAAINRTIGDLCLRYGVTISRIQRPDVEFTPNSSVHVHFGDELNVVGTRDALSNIEKVLGNSLEEIGHPQIMPIFIGISLGVLLGSWPFYLPGIPSALTLGLAGGPLLVAIFLSRIGNWGTLSWHLPKSSNTLLKDMGIVLFLACVGLHSGDEFFETLFNGSGFYWMACASLITFLPLLIVGLFGRRVLKQNYLSLCGLLAGSMTDPPALAFANSLNTSAAVSIAYASVYPMVMILRIVTAQLLVALAY